MSDFSGMRLMRFSSQVADWHRHSKYKNNNYPKHANHLYRLNSSNLIKRHNCLNKIALTNGLCNRRWIRKRNFGKKRIANRTSVPANKAMIIILIIVRNWISLLQKLFHYCNLTVSYGQQCSRQGHWVKQHTSPKKQPSGAFSWYEDFPGFLCWEKCHKHS